MSSKAQSVAFLQERGSAGRKKNSNRKKISLHPFKHQSIIHLLYWRHNVMGELRLTFLSISITILLCSLCVSSDNSKQFTIQSNFLFPPSESQTQSRSLCPEL